MRRGRHRRFLFRSYLLLVAGLLAVAIGLQFGFERLQADNQSAVDPLLQATLDLINDRLSAVEPSVREAVAASIGNEIGIPIELLPPDTIGGNTPATVETLLNDGGNRVYLYRSPTMPSIIYLGPVPENEERLLARLLPPIFYLSIVGLVGIWLRPLLSDLDTITAAAQRFAADYRTPLATATQTTQLTGLAGDLDDMSGRLSGLIQTQKELIAALSHEMRTPLARIRFALAIMENDSERSLTDGKRERIAALTADVAEIDNLIGTMLNYARLDHPDLQMQWIAVPAEAWLTSVTEKHGGSGTSLELAIEGLPTTVRMDPQLMTLALSNLLSNGERHARDKLRCSMSFDSGFCSLLVEDDGPGIPAEERSKVFKAFARLDDSRDRATGGYGLGLAIVSRIASLHGGEADVSKSPSLGGAAFRIRWPAAVS